MSISTKAIGDPVSEFDPLAATRYDGLDMYPASRHLAPRKYSVFGERLRG